MPIAFPQYVRARHDGRRSHELKWTNNWSIAATFEREFSNITSSYAGKGVVRYAC